MSIQTNDAVLQKMMDPPDVSPFDYPHRKKRLMAIYGLSEPAGLAEKDDIERWADLWALLDSGESEEFQKILDAHRRIIQDFEQRLRRLLADRYAALKKRAEDPAIKEIQQSIESILDTAQDIQNSINSCRTTITNNIQEQTNMLRTLQDKRANVIKKMKDRLIDEDTKKKLLKEIAEIEKDAKALEDLVVLTIPVGLVPAKQRFNDVNEQLNKKSQELEKHIQDLRSHKETFDALESKIRLCISQLDDDILSGARALLSEEGY